MSVVYGYIYVLTNKINNKKYVGLTTRRFNDRYPFGGIGAERMYKHHLYMKNNNNTYNKHLLCAFEKYGLNNFIVEEEFNIVYLINGDYDKAKKELDDKEKYYINLFNSMENGYNKTTGGTGDYSVITTFKPDYEIKNIFERVDYVNKFVDRFYDTSIIPQKQIDKISSYLLSQSYLSEDCHYNFYDYDVYLEPENYEVLKDDLFGIKSFLDNRKRVKNGYYKNVKWCMINDDIKNENEIRKEKSITYLKDTINDLEKIKYIVEKRCDYKKLTSINKDIEICNNYIKNECNIRQKTEQKYNDHYIYDKLKNNDIEYTKDIIMKVLKNWIEIEQESEKNPYKTISCIKMDFENVFNKIKLTDIQQNVLDNVKKGIIIGDGNHGNFQRVIEKIYKELNKN